MENTPDSSEPRQPVPPPATEAAPASSPKKKRGVLKWVVIVILLLLIGAGVIFYLNLNRILHRTIESQASASLNLPTTLGGVNLSLFGGTLDMNNLKIGSPEGFKAPQMLSLGDVDVAVDYGELRNEPVRVQRISLNAPKLVVERSGGKFNFQALMSQDSKPAPEGEPLKLIIDKLTVTNAEVQLRPGIPGVPESIDVPLPAIDINNIGTGEGNENGAAIKEVVMQVITTMTAKASESDKIPPELRQLLQLDVNAVAEKLGGEVNKQVQAITGQVQEQIQKNLKDLPPGVTEKVGVVLNRAGAPTTQAGDKVEQGVKDLLGGIGKKKEK
jgi:hypothetical protein